MKIRFALFILTIISVSATVVALTLLPAGDAAQGHGSWLANHQLALGGSLSHWSDGGMDYSFHGTFPSGWQGHINSAAVYMRSGTFATKLDYSASSANLISIEEWPDLFGFLRNERGKDTCDYAGTVGSTVACTWPIASDLSPVDYWSTGFLDNLYRMRIAFDPADVYVDPSATSPVVRSEWTNDRVIKYSAHEFGHALGYFDHSAAGNLMYKEIGTPYNLALAGLTDNDKWNLNRLYIYTRGTGSADACRTTLPLKATEAMRIGNGKIYPVNSSGTSISGRFNTACPSTSYDSNGLAHYYELNHNVGRSQGFEVTTINGAPTDVRQYIHNSDDNPYKRGTESPFASSANSSEATVDGSKLVQVASTMGDSSLQYKLKIAPVESDCIRSGNTEFTRAISGRTGSATLSDDACLSSNTNRGYSEFYGLSGDGERVTITLESERFDIHLYLRRGEDIVSGAWKADNYDVAADGKRSASITRRLDSTEYTIEVTS